MKLQAPEIALKTIERVEPAEFRRWIGRFAVIDQALEGSKASWLEGWGENGITAWHVANPTDIQDKSYTATMYERLQMLQLSSALPTKGRIPYLPVDMSAPELEHVTATASAEALKRVGILDETLTPTAGALAVYAMTRADIYQAPDRFMVASMPTTGAENTPARLGKLGIRVATYWTLMYGDGTQIPTLENYQQWWQQLDGDLTRVDEAFAG